MWSVARKAAVFLGLWVLILGAVAAAGERIAPIYGDIKQKRALLRKNAGRIQVVSIGNSHSLAVDFSAIHKDGFHLWQGGSDLHEATFLAREVMPALPELRCVLVSLSPYTVDADNGAPAALSRAARRRQLYTRTFSFDYIAGDRDLFIMGKLAPLVRDDHWKQVLAALAGHKRRPVQMNGAPPVDPNFWRAMPVDSLEIDGRKDASEHAALVEEVVRARPSARRGGVRALHGLFNAVASRNITVVLYTPPLHRSYINALQPGRLDETRTIGTELSAQYDNASYIDYSQAEPFASRPELFMDSNHLNGNGARIFSRMLADRLQAEGRSACLSANHTPPLD